MAEGECLLLAQLGLGQDFSGLFTGGGVHVEVLEEDLGATGGRSATLGVVLGLDVDGRGHRGVRVIEGRSLAVGAGDTVALGFGGLDDELQVGHIGGSGAGKAQTVLRRRAKCGVSDGGEGLFPP